jgi:hypothetical protein
MKARKLLLTCLVISLLITSQVWAVTITDLDPTDQNIITATHSPGGNWFIVEEDYGEESLIPYPSHDGYAIVDDEPLDPFFDKVVTVNQADILSEGGVWFFGFVVENTTPYIWSDYHFEFWNEDFSDPLSSVPLLVVGDPYIDPSSSIFNNQSFDGSVLEFWAPEWQDPGEINQFGMMIDLLQLGVNPDIHPDPDTGQYSFGIRQVATTAIPEPGTMLLLGFGLLGLAGYGIHRKKKNS